ncbi:hypothetical protein CBA19CS22_16170 [Caballeronia novacaledonica]|uniref:Uncharacterized protein n=1 Tax=Caballeronia novacaledonica TaxID=1544861 RepID=A0ACB5QTE5_9BURK|nr:hypothetical protein CBA19CS22_16170 [Caballeronia novacaledonica]
MLIDLARISGVSLELTASESPKFAVIVATNQGSAIAAEQLEIIFGRFYGVNAGGREFRTRACCLLW